MSVVERPKPVSLTMTLRPGKPSGEIDQPSLTINALEALSGMGRNDRRLVGENRRYPLQGRIRG